MTTTDPIESLRDDELAMRAQELIRAGWFMFDRGWVPATSGNFSARLSDGRIAITVSGAHKGHLTEEEIMVADAEGRTLQSGKRPSAETLLHTAIYRRFPEAGAVLHVHSMSATLLSRLYEGELLLEDYELLKAFEGIDTHETFIRIPIFPNDQDISRLAAKVDEYLDTHGPVHGYLIAGHGIYAWGPSVKQTLYYLEAFDFLFQCELQMQRLAK